MSLDPAYWIGLAEDYLAAYVQCFPSAGGGAQGLPSRNAIVLAMSVAEHETNNGRAWPGTNNFGAVQLRPLTAQEYTAWQEGALHAGDFTPDRSGVLHIDTHPTPSGPQPYPVWFVAFAARVEGIAHFLKTLWRLSGGAPDDADASPPALATAMYMHGYYEGAHPGRPLAHRSFPLTSSEQANVNDYAVAIQRCEETIGAALGNWDPDPPQNQEPIDPAAGQGTLPAA